MPDTTLRERLSLQLFDDAEASWDEIRQRVLALRVRSLEADLQGKRNPLKGRGDAPAGDAPVVLEYVDEYNPDRVIARRVDHAWLARRTHELLGEQGKAASYTAAEYENALRLAQAEGDREVRRLGGDGIQAFDHAQSPWLDGAVAVPQPAPIGVQEMTGDWNNELARRVGEILAEKGIDSPTSEDYNAAIAQARRERPSP